MDPIQGFIEWGAKVGGAGAMAFGLIALHKRWFVHHAELDRMVVDRDRERDRAEKAEQRLIDTIPVLTRAYEQISRVPHVAEKAVETAAEAVKTVKAAGGKQE